MKKRRPHLTITRTPAFDLALRDRVTGTHSGSRSANIARMVDRYTEICRRCQPNLTESEWAIVFDVLGGAWHEPASSIAYIEHRIRDANNFRHLDADSLLGKLFRLDYAGLVAIVDLAERQRP